MKTTIKIYIFLAIIIILFAKVSMGGLERIKNQGLIINTPFIYDTSRSALNLANPNNYTNGYGIFALVGVPLGLVALPATFIADTVSLPYDYYLYKKFESQFVFLKKAHKNLTKDFSMSEKADYQKNYSEYVAYSLHMSTRHDARPAYIHPNKVVVLLKLAHKYSEYKYSGNILNDLCKPHDLTDKTLDELFKLTTTDVDAYRSLILKMISGEYFLKQSFFSESYYHFLISNSKVAKETKTAILQSIERAYMKHDKSTKFWVEKRNKLLKMLEKPDAEIINKDNAIKFLDDATTEVEQKLPINKILKNRLSKIRNYLATAE